MFASKKLRFPKVTIQVTTSVAKLSTPLSAGTECPCDEHGDGEFQDVIRYFRRENLSHQSHRPRQITKEARGMRAKVRCRIKPVLVASLADPTVPFADQFVYLEGGLRDGTWRLPSQRLSAARGAELPAQFGVGQQLAQRAGQLLAAAGRDEQPCFLMLDQLRCAARRGGPGLRSVSDLGASAGQIRLPTHSARGPRRGVAAFGNGPANLLQWRMD